MRSAAAFIADQPGLFAPPAAVIRPWDYIRLRREATGQSIEQVARRFYANDDHRADVEANLRMFESPGVTVKDVRWLNLDRAFPFDPEIYRLLAETAPEHHPRLCRGCGWDQWASQVDRLGNDCTWSESDPAICTLCEHVGRTGA